MVVSNSLLRDEFACEMIAMVTLVTVSLAPRQFNMEFSLYFIPVIPYSRILNEFSRTCQWISTVVSLFQCKEVTFTICQPLFSWINTYPRCLELDQTFHKINREDE